MIKPTNKWLLLVVLILLGLLFIGNPAAHSSRIYREVWESGHLFLFAGLIYLISHHARYNRLNIPQQLLFVILFCSIFGLITELLQQLVGRNFELKDIVNDIIGGYIGLSFSYLRRSNPLKVNFGLFSICLLLSIWGLLPLLSALNDQWEIEKIFPHIAQFESTHELNRWYRQDANISLSQKFKAQGLSSMKVEFLPAKYPHVTLRHFISNWLNYQQLNLSIYNPQNQTVSMTLKVYDKLHQQNHYQYSDRFNRILQLPPGWTHFQQSLTEIANAPKKRPMEMQHVAVVSLFLDSPKTTTTLFIDNIYLSK
ncbi:VanZ family protein [Aliikangiella maris]|uniref:VanZ family protein n=2 Tax=Aliikangiella maris TaxID=3162458 RepID=A0ABV3MJ20_9GAMM